jgi:hypothetical protein
MRCYADHPTLSRGSVNHAHKVRWKVVHVVHRSFQGSSAMVTFAHGRSLSVSPGTGDFFHLFTSSPRRCTMLASGSAANHMKNIPTGMVTMNTQSAHPTPPSGNPHTVNHTHPFVRYHSRFLNDRGFRFTCFHLRARQPICERTDGLPLTSCAATAAGRRSCRLRPPSSRTCC